MDINPDDVNNYEQAENGICPINCKHCLKNNKCLKCRNDFVRVANNKKIECLSSNETNKGYYQNNNIYYSCIDNCDICSNNNSCNNCSLGFDYYNKKCHKKIDNCEEYSNNGNCTKCKYNFAFKEDNRNICLNKDNFTNYYTKDNGISYHLCENEIDNCSKCYYDKNETKVNCYLCQTNFFLLIDEEICLSKDLINKTYYYLNETHINKCSNSIENCDECEDDITCSKCEKDFYIINDNNDSCINISTLPIDEYYINEEETRYYSCNNTNYQDVNNCKICSSKTNCTLCQDNFTFIDGNKSYCINKEELIDKYIQDPLDISNYIRCENKYNNCDSCNDTICLICKEDFAFINDNYSICLLKSSLNMSEYFTNDNITYYSCKEEIYKERPECQNIISEKIKDSTSIPDSTDYNKISIQDSTQENNE